MADCSDVDWETCAADECVGEQLASGGRCWAHADYVDLGPALARLSEGGQLEGRGVVFTAGLLQRLLDATPKDDEGRPVISTAQLCRATFTDVAGFDRATFTDVADFDEATFEGVAEFEGATFEGVAGFDGANFNHITVFDGATFEGKAVFVGATFNDGADFVGATFNNGAVFGATFKGRAVFDGAKFNVGTVFDGATFEGDAVFTGAVFMGRAGFNGATFNGDARFEGSTIKAAGFRSATFIGYAGFSEATFDSPAEFDGGTFKGVAAFAKATFKHYAAFDRTTFHGYAVFDGVTLDDAGFNQATFDSDAMFDGATFHGHGVTSFERATFERAQQLGPMLVRSWLLLDGALFRERIQIEVSAAVLSCQRTRFLAGVQLRVRWAQVVLDGADLAAPSVLSGAIRFENFDEGHWPRVPGSPWPVDPYGTPRLLSVRGADVAGLTVAGVDLRACRFVDAHHLDQLRAEGSNFANTPRGWRWTRRRTIAEEHQWRASEDDEGWYGLENQPPEWLEVKELTPGQAGLLLPEEIAALYRDLRKGLEDNKDEPGAADFYYGEMEMRRHAKRQDVHLERTLRFRNGGFGSSAAAEYAILSLYWLVSGYGLRAWRALATLTAVVLVASVIFAFWGFEPNSRGLDELPTALLFSTQATTALLRGTDPRALTMVGEWLQVALRLIGPVLLGLAVLSVRGRVKR